MRILSRIRGEQGFSLVEVLIAVVVLGLTGVALLNGLQSTVLQSRATTTGANAAISLSAAAEILKAAPFVSCADDPTPYEQLPNGLALPTGLTIDVQEFIATATTPWQACNAVERAGSVQQITIRDAKGSTRTLLRFAATTASSTPTPTPTPTTALNATAVVDTTSSCGTFRTSRSTRQCVITFTRTAGSGSQWHLGSVTFAGGPIFNPAPTAPVAQSTPIVLSTYLTDGGLQCPRAQVIPISVTLVDDGNSSSVTLQQALTC